MPTRTLQPNDADAKQLEDLRKANAAQSEKSRKQESEQLDRSGKKQSEEARRKKVSAAQSRGNVKAPRTIEAESNG